MKAFGITQSEREENRLKILKVLRRVGLVFVLICLLPVLVVGLFEMKVLNGQPFFSSDIQEPIAKLTTPFGVGTAFLVSPTKLLTARHMIEGMNKGDEVTLSFEKSQNPGAIYKGKIIYIEPTSQSIISGTATLDYFISDFAVIEVPEMTDILPLTIGESDAISLLDEVILIGYPGADYSISKGNINNDKYQGYDLFKLDATSNPGNSGGPCILKNDNSVIGILVGGSKQLQGENIALKINHVKEKLKGTGVDLNK